MLNLPKIEAVLVNEARYRLKQVDRLIFQDLVEDWQEGTTLPLILRQTLSEQAPIAIKGETFVSADGKTQKVLLSLEDGLSVESVWMRFEDRNTLCVSSQVGCPLGCLFCATGQMGFKRDLSVSEIVNQVLFFARLLKKEGQKITNVVFMGMGEPFLNYDNVLGAIKLLNDPGKMGLGARRFSISTCGIVEGINKLADEPMEINLAISLHAPNNDLRSKLMPINQKYPIEKITEAVEFYLQKTKRKVMFEYVLLDGVNDNELSALQLARLLKRPLYHLNLIQYNQYNQTGSFRSSKPSQVATFKKVLAKKGIPFTERYRFGSEIHAACGQLAGKSK